MGGSGADPEDGAVLSQQTVDLLLKHGLANGPIYRVEADGSIGAKVYLPDPPKNHPPKPERAFWRGAPRKAGRR